MTFETDLHLIRCNLVLSP